MSWIHVRIGAPALLVGLGVGFLAGNLAPRVVPPLTGFAVRSPIASKSEPAAQTLARLAAEEARWRERRSFCTRSRAWATPSSSPAMHAP